MDKFEANCALIPDDTICIGRHRSGLEIWARTIEGDAFVDLSQSDCDRLADFLVDAGFGAAADRPDVSGHDARDDDEPSDFTRDEDLDDRFDNVFATIDIVQGKIMGKLGSLAGKVAVLERRMNSAAVEMKG